LLRRLLALALAARHVLLEGLGLRDVGLLGLGVVRVEDGRGRVTSVSLLLAPVVRREVAGRLRVVLVDLVEGHARLQRGRENVSPSCGESRGLSTNLAESAGHAHKRWSPTEESTWFARNGSETQFPLAATQGSQINMTRAWQIGFQVTPPRSGHKTGTGESYRTT